jgi:hypothetical protein
MSTLVALEPAALRRLLKGGLRRGLSPEQLDSIFQDGWGRSLDSPDAQEFLQLLVERGWLQVDGSQWKTRLG